MSENSIASTGRTSTAYTGRTKKRIPGWKVECMTEGRSTGSSVEEVQKGTTSRDGEVEAITQVKLFSVYGSVK